MAQPVSWKVIERGWRVVAVGGEEVGTIHEVVGDEGADIFNGLAVSPGFLQNSRYVPSEDVGEIVDGEVRLHVAKEQFGQLEPWHGAPRSARLDSGTTHL